MRLCANAAVALVAQCARHEMHMYILSHERSVSSQRHHQRPLPACLPPHHRGQRQRCLHSRLFVVVLLELADLLLCHQVAVKHRIEGVELSRCGDAETADEPAGTVAHIERAPDGAQVLGHDVHCVLVSARIDRRATVGGVGVGVRGGGARRVRGLHF